MEEGLPFCPHCGAPQIRVLPPEDEGGSVPISALPSNEPGAARIETPGSVWTQGRPTYTLPSTPIQWNIAWRGALLAGILAGILCDLPFLSYGFLLWLLGAGGLAVSTYARRVPGVLVTSGMGLRIGALAGFFAFLLNAIGTTLMFTVEGDTVRKMLQEQIEASIAKSPDPKAQQILQEFVARLSTPEGMATFFVLLLLVLGVLFALFAAAGGALGASLSRQKGNLR